jgi:hypothetical protein
MSTTWICVSCGNAIAVSTSTFKWTCGCTRPGPAMVPAEDVTNVTNVTNCGDYVLRVVPSWE